tara:strand:+ start:6320 stop:6907 length:588 start_codon:yes stop_codon:yes gene_type:complete
MKIYNFKKITFSLISILSLVILTNSCGLYERSDVKDNPINDADKRQKNMNEGNGIRGVLGRNRKSGNGQFDFASSNEMWRATLDILDFIPLSTADYGGGIVITDWYSDKEDEAIKLTIRFLSNDIRADGIDVGIHKKNCAVEKSCSIKKIDGTLNLDIKLAILKRAAQIRKGDIKNRNEGRGEEIIAPRSAGKKD